MEIKLEPYGSTHVWYSGALNNACSARGNAARDDAVSAAHRVSGAG